MSHLVPIKLQIKDLNCLKKATEQMGFTFNEDAKTFRSYRTGNCDHSIHIPNAAYEIGIRKVETTNIYTMHMDEFSPGGLVPIVGRGASKLVQQYSKEVVKKEARLKGYSVMEKIKENGDLQLTINIP